MRRRFLFSILFFLSVFIYSFDTRYLPFKFYFLKGPRRKNKIITLKHIGHPTQFLSYKMTEEEIKDLFARINLNFSGLESIKEEYENGNYRTALENLINYLDNRDFPTYFDYTWKENRPPKDEDYNTSEADAIKQHSIEFDGIEGNPGTPINWNYKANNYDEWNYALNRLYFLYPLIDAYWNTYDKSYADYAIEDLADWMINGPSNYDRVLEHSYRVITMIDTYYYLKDVLSFSIDLKGLFLLKLSQEGEYLKDHIPTGGWLSAWWYSSILICRMFPFLKISSDLLPLAEEKMENYFEENYYTDGYAKTSSLMYHVYVESALYFYVIELYKQNNWEFPDFDNIKRILHTYGEVFEPDYTIPLIGEGEKRGEEVFIPLLRKAADILEDEELLYLATKGKKGIEPSYTSIFANDSRMFFCRKDFSRESDFLFFNIGYGEGYHNHFDYLSYIYYFNKELIIRDSGVKSYEEPIRSYFKKSSLHNLPLFDGLGEEYNQDIPTQLRGVVDFYRLSNVLDYMKGHINLSQIKENLIFYRTVWYLKSNFLLINDAFYNNDMTIDEYIQVGKEFYDLDVKNKYIIANSLRNKVFLYFIPNFNYVSMYYGSEEPFLGWYSDKFNKIYPAYTLQCNYNSNVKNWIFIISPNKKIDIILFEEKDVDQWFLKIKRDSKYYYFIENNVFSSITFNDFTLNGSYGYVVVNENNGVEKVISDGTILYKGREIKEKEVIDETFSKNYNSFR